jgi:hypothetical protein
MATSKAPGSAGAHLGSETAGLTSCWINPGRKKLAGETLWLALMPLQPDNAIVATAIAANGIRRFALLMARHYKFGGLDGNS